MHAGAQRLHCTRTTTATRSQLDNNPWAAVTAGNNDGDSPDLAVVPPGVVSLLGRPVHDDEFMVFYSTATERQQGRGAARGICMFAHDSC